MPVEVIEALLRHTWPGNVRELRAAAEAFAEHNVGQAVASVPTLSGPAPATGGESGPEVMVDDILDALEAHDWAILPTSRALGVSRNTLRRHMEQRGLRRLKDVPAGEVEAALAAADGDLIEAARRLRVSASGLRLWRA
jgi:two-component system C4-dicarboxylate transport response regulator DctD